MSTVYDYNATTSAGENKSLADFKNKVLLVVNTASKCGFTPQYKGLQSLHETYKDQGFAVLGFPCNQFANQEPGNSKEIQSFCEINYGVTFPLFEKIEVKGANIHPLFKHLNESAPGILGTKSIKWNFTKFLIDRKGNVVKRYAPTETPEKIELDIQQLLGGGDEAPCED